MIFQNRAIEMVASAYLYLFTHSGYAPFESYPAMDNLWDAYVHLYRKGARRMIIPVAPMPTR